MREARHDLRSSRPRTAATQSVVVSETAVAATNYSFDLR
jgi:hypothetical protein